MSKVKKQVTCGILICALFFAVSIPAGAENSTEASTGEQVEEDAGEASGIMPETPTETAPQTQGKAEIEKYFPPTDNSGAAKGENNADMNLSDTQRESSQELPIIYEQQEEKASTEASVPTTGGGVHRWNKLLLLAIPMIFVLLFVVIKKFVKKEEVRR